MTGRTTVNVDKTEHREAREVKDEYGESWSDVFRFYSEHRSDLSLSGDEELRALLEQLPERTAEELEGRLR